MDYLNIEINDLLTSYVKLFFRKAWMFNPLSLRSHGTPYKIINPNSLAIEIFME